MPHLVQLDHHGATFGLGLLGVELGELLDPGHHAGGRHPQELGGPVHRQPAQVEEHGGDLDPERHAARRGVGEVEPARLAAVALLAPHQAVPDVLPAPAPLAPQPHRPAPPAVPPPTDIGNLRRPKTLQIIFTTHSEYALKILPPSAIWASIDGNAYHGKLTIESLRAITGSATKDKVILLRMILLRTFEMKIFVSSEAVLFIMSKYTKLAAFLM